MRALRTKVNINPPDSDFPFGRMRDDDGTNNGTPADENFVGDMSQFFEKLMLDGGLAANNLPDQAYTGFQLNQALAAYIDIRINLINGNLLTKIVNIGSWNMNSGGAGTQSVNVAHGLGGGWTNIRRISFIIINDAGTAMYPSPNIHASVNNEIGISVVDSTNINIQHNGAASFFNTAGTFTGAGNRGYIIIEHV